MFDMKAFHRWVRESNSEALIVRKDTAQSQLPKLEKQPDVLAQAKKMIQIIEEELDVRRQLRLVKK